MSLRSGLGCGVSLKRGDEDPLFASIGAISTRVLFQDLIRQIGTGLESKVFGETQCIVTVEENMGGLRHS